MASAAYKVQSVRQPLLGTVSHSKRNLQLAFNNCCCSASVPALIFKAAAARFCRNDEVKEAALVQAEAFFKPKGIAILDNLLLRAFQVCFGLCHWPLKALNSVAAQL